MLFKKLVYCPCKSGRPYDFCCAPKVKMREIPITDPNERDDIIRKLLISKEFKLRNRGFFSFYGEDLIQYKLERPNCEKRNTFLTVFGEYLTWYLEDFCPKSWNEMDYEFWKELLLTYFPPKILITKEEKQVDYFINELTTFVKKIDRKRQTNFLPIINSLLDQYESELHYCEQLINIMFLQKYPKVHDPDWDIKKDIEKCLDLYNHVDQDEYSIFEVINMDGVITVLEDIDNLNIYHVLDLPNKALKKGIIISGGIGKLKNDWLWTWIYPEGAFPKHARKYLKNIIIF